MKTFVLSFFIFTQICVGNNLFAQHNMACLPKSKFQDAWQQVGPFFDSSNLANQHFGAISCISANPQKDSVEIYIGTPTGGLWYTNNGGVNWKNISDTYNEAVVNIQKVYVNYSVTPHTIAIAIGDGGSPVSASNAGVLVSKNNGASWQAATWDAQDYKVGMPPVTDLIQSKTNYNIWFASVNNFVFRSVDNLQSFQKIFPLNKTHLDALNVPSAVYITQLLLHDASGNLYFTNRKLMHWNGASVDDYRPTLCCIKNALDANANVDVENLSANMRANITDWKSSEGMQLVFNNTKPNSITLLNTFEQQATKRPFISFCDMDVNTQKFTKPIEPKIPNQNFSLEWFDGIRYNSKNPAIAYLAGYVLNKSSDSCNTFKESYYYDFGYNNTPHADLRTFEIVNCSANGLNDHIILGTDGGVSYSSNSGKTFRNLNGKSLPITQFYGLDVSQFSGMVSAGSQDNSILSYNPTKNLWRAYNQGDGYDVAYSLTKPGYAVGQHNAGTTYFTTNDDIPFANNFYFSPNQNANRSSNIQMLPSGNCYLSAKNLFKLEANSKRWQTIAVPPQIDAYIGAYAVCASNENIMYISNLWNNATNSIFKSVDGGITWKSINNLFKVEGATPWSAANAKTTKIITSPYNTNEVWVALDYKYTYDLDFCKGINRVWYSADGGETWQDYSNGLPAAANYDLQYIQGTSGALLASNINGVFLRESVFSSWKLLGTNLPNSVILEMAIDYCSNNIYAATYGRGLWKMPLPKLDYDYPIKIKNNETYTMQDSNAVKLINSDIVLAKKATLTIDCKIHMGSPFHIYARKATQVKFTERGKLLNNCDATWQGVILKK